MTEQRRSVIIKSLAYGLDIKFAAECNDVTTEEVERLADECRWEEVAARLGRGTADSWKKAVNFEDSHYYIDIATKKGEAISFKFKGYGNNSKGYLYFLYYTSVS